MSIEDIKEWEELTPEKRKTLLMELAKRYPPLFCWLIKNIKKCVCEEGHR